MPVATKKTIPPEPLIEAIVDGVIDITVLVTIRSSEDLGLTRGVKYWII